MKTITISTENCETYSSISNFFIDYYMTEANGEFVKVYLYLVRLLNTNSNITVAGIADHFNLTENDICRAIKYWISRDVLKLNYDGKGHLRGIVLLPLHAPALDMRMDTDAVSILRIEPAVDTEPGYDTVNAATKEEPVVKTAPATAALVPNTELSLPTKPRYSVNDISKAMSDSDFESLVYLTETLFGRPITPNETKTIMYIYESLEFSVDLFEYLVEYCVEKGKTNFRYLESVAIGWYKDGIKTKQEAQDQIYQTNHVAGTVFKALGIRGDRTVTQAEIELINTWTNDLGFSEDIIEKACQSAILTKPAGVSLHYVNGILEDWSKNNVKTMADVEALQKAHAAKYARDKAMAQGGKSGSNITSFNDFKQSTSDKSIDDMELRLLREVNKK
ncbi:MAG: DnaD domain protein [Lachnospiraceae bacterium]|nr:DnaD domain protein [Lachnospiraceae bacterium]